MILLRKDQIVEALPKINKGLEQYLWIQNEFIKRNTATDREFQKKFNAFYRVRRNAAWQKEFYQLLESNKTKDIRFEHILKKFHDKTGRMEASFVSKLIATINSNMPVIDKVVFKNLGLRLPTATVKNRDSIINEQYQILFKEFSDFLKTENGKYLVEQFIKEYPKAKITKVKMLDFVLWQTRD